MSIIDQMRAINPERRVEFTAIDELNTPREIEAFYHDLIVEQGKEVAEHNIGYILGYYSKEKQAFWKDVLGKAAEHPFDRAAIKYRFVRDIDNKITDVVVSD